MKYRKVFAPYCSRSRSVRLVTTPSTIDENSANRNAASKCDKFIFGISLFFPSRSRTHPPWPRCSKSPLPPETSCHSRAHAPHIRLVVPEPNGQQVQHPRGQIAHESADINHRRENVSGLRLEH